MRLQSLVPQLAGVWLLAACKTAAPAGPASADDWKTSELILEAEADALCAKELVGCAHPFGKFELPADPCVGLGADCRERGPSSKGRWVCGCESCSSDLQCGKDEHCGTEAPVCPPNREPRTCRPGPQPPPPECPPPPPRR